MPHSFVASFPFSSMPRRNPNVHDDFGRISKSRLQQTIGSIPHVHLFSMRWNDDDQLNYLLSLNLFLVLKSRKREKNMSKFQIRLKIDVCASISSSYLHPHEKLTTHCQCRYRPWLKLFLFSLLRFQNKHKKSL